MAAQEICDNCIDDDGDGLIDCYDPDCCGVGPCIGNSFDCLPTKTQDCAVVYPVTIEPLWTNSKNIDTRRTPIAGDIDNDGDVEIVIAGSGNQGLHIINGKTGVTEQVLPFNANGFFDAPALGDVNQDGFAEIFAVTNGSVLIRWEYNGTLFIESPTISSTWTANPTIGYGSGTAFNWSPALADFNHDGIPEVYFANQIYNSLTGELVAEHLLGTNTPFGRSSTGANVKGAEAYSVAADVLPASACAHCDGLELVAGPAVYSVNFTTKTLNLEVDARGPNNVDDGATSIADWDGDGELDVVVNSADCYLYVYNPRTGNLIHPPFQIPGASLNSHPSVSDIDNDGQVELVAPGRNVVVALDNDFSLLWQKPSNDGSSKTTASLYDLNGDYIFELIYLDEDGLHIWDAATGDQVQFIPCASGTRTNYPIVADVNSDGEANIICSCREQSPFPGDKGATGQVHAYKSKDYAWLPSRRVMNQHSYYITNINDDLTICQYQQNNAKSRKLNQFLSQTTYYGGLIGSPVADATIGGVTIDEYRCDTNQTKATLSIDVCNLDGDIPIPPNTAVALYEDEPSLGNLLQVLYTPTQVDTGQCISITTSVKYATAITLYIQVNDEASVPDEDLDQVFLECDSSNNQFAIPLPIRTPSFELDSVDALCTDSANGKAFPLNVVDFTSPLAYNWSDGTTGDTLFNIAGTYTLTISDVHACTYQESIAFGEPPPLVVTTSSTDAGCDDDPIGSITASASGGTPGYQFSLNSNPFQNAGSFSALASGSYTVAVQDTNGCRQQETVNINYPGNTPVIAIDSVPPLCLLESDRFLTITPSGGTTSGNGIISSSPPIFSPQTAGVGTHTITYSIGGVCGATQTRDIIVTDTTDAAISAPDTLCAEAAPITLSASPGGGQWQSPYINNSGIFKAPPGNHRVVYVNTSDCGVNDTTFIEVRDTLQLVSASLAVPCFGDSLPFYKMQPQHAASPLTYIWDNTLTFTHADSAFQIFAGTYSMQVLDNLGCSASGTLQVTEPTAIQILDRTTQDISCVTPVVCDGAVTYQLTGGTVSGLYTFTADTIVNASSTENTLIQLCPRTYSIVISDDNGCTINDSFVIGQPTPIVAIIDTVGDEHCRQNDGFIELSSVTGGNPPYSFQWQHGTDTQNAYNLAAGNYTLTITDIVNCSIQLDTLLNHISGPDFQFSSSPISCFQGADGELEIINEPSNIVSYSWSNGISDTIISDLPAGSYSATITDVFGCDTTQSFTLADGPQVDIASINDIHLCPNESRTVYIQASDGNGAPYSYFVNLNPIGGDSITVSSPQTVAFHGTDALGCSSDTLTFSVTQSSPLQIQPLRDTTVCENEPVTYLAQTINGRPPFDYIWTNQITQNQATYVANQPKTITVTVNDICDETVQAEATISLHPIPEIGYSLSPETGCVPLEVQYTIDIAEITQGQILIEDQWQPLISSGEFTHVYFVAGEYPATLSFTTLEGCLASQAIAPVSAYPIPDAKIVCNPSEINSYQLHTLVKLANEQHVARTEWLVSYQGDTVAVHTSYPFTQHFPDQEDVYTIYSTLISEHGCINYLQHELQIDILSDLFIPNTFTPDNDSFNDFFFAEHFNIRSDNFEIRIFDRWGEEIYFSTDPDFQWDGTYLGLPVQQGLYVYKVKYSTHNAAKKQVFGHVNVLR